MASSQCDIHAYHPIYKVRALETGQDTECAQLQATNAAATMHNENCVLSIRVTIQYTDLHGLQIRVPSKIDLST